jgi:hypothetical protein
MRYSPHTATHLMRLREQELRAHAERRRCETSTSAGRRSPGLRTALVAIVLVLAPSAVLISSFAGRGNW